MRKLFLLTSLLSVLLFPFTLFAVDCTKPIHTFFSNISADANATACTFTTTTGLSTMKAEATSWGSGTIKMQSQSPNGTWVDMGVSCTANCQKAFRESVNTSIRAVLTGATSPTGVYVYITGNNN